MYSVVQFSSVCSKHKKKLIMNHHLSSQTKQLNHYTEKKTKSYLCLSTPLSS